ncbi:SH3 domain-binding protein 5-like [Cyclopterus lumpus]|uniref:SH3 domain-binding protein 5-like n=1 Tax=Cyclopterus lumpus TaxID=8103 RepID=UPI0014869DA2|nr:SH3 domain-binding protein 5-like [Cyclopterus lumpus]
MDHLEKELRAEDEAEHDDEEVDPRVQGELEKLNQSTDDINRCETELEDARQKFRSVLVEATVKLDELVKKIGKAVEESKPYWEARKSARQVLGFLWFPWGIEPPMSPLAPMDLTTRISVNPYPHSFMSNLLHAGNAASQAKI